MTGQRSVSEMLGRLFACLSVCLLFLGLLLIQKARVTLHVRSRNPSFSPGKDRTYTWVFNKYLLNEWVKDKQYPSKLQRGGKTLGIICHEWERNHFTQRQIKVKITFSPNMVIVVNFWGGKKKKDVGEFHNLWIQVVF